ncbi:circadian clock protein KaiC [Ectothiorhodospiraceae bacterium 2226]|nr:circadian clock protein KaiC [Ectothiorhodospiraceae bacterium 2226]
MLNTPTRGTPATAQEAPALLGLTKVPSGIPGFDDITEGGLPRGRTSLVCGAAGCGKTLFGMQFLVRGALDHDEPGVFIAFEETEQDLVQNVASLGFDLNALVDAGKLAMDHIRVERNEIEENGEYNLEGLFLRLELAIQSVGAKRVVIDTLETLFGGLDNYAILRSELRRLFQWLKDRGVSAVITAERGEGTLTRHGLEEYVSDCVILLDHRVSEQISTRRLRVVKYRGTTHGTNEYPFLIDEAGITVMPITAAGLHHDVSDERVSSGVPRLDTMLGGEGYYRGSTVLVSGTAGAGKSSLAAHFADATCARGERCIYFAFEESPQQIKRNMRSIGVDLGAHEQAGLLRFVAARPTMHGLETHLAVMHKQIRDFQPTAVVVDPVGNLIAAANQEEAHLMVVRLVDFLKLHGITSVMTSLTSGGAAAEATEIAISSIVDTWLLVKSIEASGERNRGLYILKSRGMAHSHQVREFVITSEGIDLVDVYIGAEGVLTGSARVQQENRERAAAVRRAQEIERKQRELERQRHAMEHQIAALRAEFEAQEAEMARIIEQEQAVEEQLLQDRSGIASRRGADTSD